MSRLRSPMGTKVPTVLQMEASECAAACLAMVLAHHGRHEPLESLRVACGVARDGSNAANLVAAARSFGLDTKAVRCEPNELDALAMPAIIHWRFNHFVVLESRSRSGWHINDPAVGPRTCSDTEFDESFTGVAVTFTPGDRFEPTGRRPGVPGRMLAAAGNTTGIFAFIALIAVLSVVPAIVIPQLVRQFANNLSGAGGIDGTAAASGLAAIAVVLAVVVWLQGNVAMRVAARITIRVSATMVYRLFRLPAAFHDQRDASALAQRARLANQLGVAAAAVAAAASTGLLSSVAALVVLMVINLPVGIVAMTVTTVAAVTLGATMQRNRDDAACLVRETVDVSALQASALHQIEAIKASGVDDGVIARGSAAQNRLAEASALLGLRSLRLTVIPAVTAGASAVAVAAVAAWQTNTGRIDIGLFVATLALTAMVVAPLSAVVTAADRAQTMRAVLDQITDITDFDNGSELENAPSPHAPATLQGELEFRAVTFGYSHRSPPILTSVDFRVLPGQRIALVGASGSGKSTASRLIGGLYTPWEGEVLIDGIARPDHAPQVLANQVTVVDQDIAVFAGTIRDNVTLWDRTISDTAVSAALSDADLGTDVAQRPGGLDAVLREGGADLSAGQRQRLDIARALARNPAIVVLDEATSALDPLTEKRIDAAIRRRAITCVVIAHRLSTIRDSDHIVVFDNGCVVEAGTHDQLMALKGTYAELVAS